MISTLSAVGEKRAGPAPHHIERLERRIAEMRMTAATQTDWEQLRVRSREIFARLDRNISASTQIAMALRMRGAMRQANDVSGLRALRFATASLFAGWLDEEGTREKAQKLARLFDADQSRGIPGLAELQAELGQARCSAGAIEQVRHDRGETR